MNTHDDNFQKFLSLEEEKRERIINAAMHEFLGGYKKASTDVIVKEAGISKGMLFHYFGTKERLYNFLIDYATNIMQKEYFDLINVLHKDILDSVWQLSLLKRDLSLHFPDIFDFLTSAYVDTTAKSEGLKDTLTRVYEMRAKILEEVYAHADYSLFRDDVDPKLVMQIITWTLQGYAQSKLETATGENLGSTSRENYDIYLNELQEISNMLRKCFYKPKI